MAHDAVYLACLKGERLWHISHGRSGPPVPAAILGRASTGGCAPRVGAGRHAVGLHLEPRRRGGPKADDDRMVRLTLS